MEDTIKLHHHLGQAGMLSIVLVVVVGFIDIPLDGEYAIRCWHLGDEEDVRRYCHELGCHWLFDDGMVPAV